MVTKMTTHVINTVKKHNVSFMGKERNMTMNWYDRQGVVMMVMREVFERIMIVICVLQKKTQNIK